MGSQSRTRLSDWTEVKDNLDFKVSGLELGEFTALWLVCSQCVIPLIDGVYPYSGWPALSYEHRGLTTLPVSPISPSWCRVAHIGFDETQVRVHVPALPFISCVLSLFSHSVVSGSLRPRGLQRARLPCPSPTPGARSNSCPLSRWCHPTSSSSAVPFSCCLQSFPASGSSPVSQLFASGGQSTGVSASASVLPVDIQGWSPLGWSIVLNKFINLPSLSLLTCKTGGYFIPANSHWEVLSSHATRLTSATWCNLLTSMGAGTSHEQKVRVNKMPRIMQLGSCTFRMWTWAALDLVFHFLLCTQVMGFMTIRWDQLFPY